ncbi:unnamed protein product, partial [Urochloa humidicola]
PTGAGAATVEGAGGQRAAAGTRMRQPRGPVDGRSRRAAMVDEAL